MREQHIVCSVEHGISYFGYKTDLNLIHLRFYSYIVSVARAPSIFVVAWLDIQQTQNYEK